MPLRKPGARGRLWQILERLLIVIGLVSLGYFGYVSAESHLYQKFENRELDAILTSGPDLEPDAPVSRLQRPRPAQGAAIGRIEIPRLGVSVVIRAGSDARTLRLAVGHVPGTAFPGEIGNIGLAGHRDTFFRRLRDIQPEDEIRIVTVDGAYSFRVADTRVVAPHETWVLDATNTAILTLVTCYPFTFVGSAPKRFIVRATGVQS